MKGRKPNIAKVIPMRPDGPAVAEAREQAIALQVARLRPRGMDAETRREWDRVAAMLAEPTVDRLKPRFVDTIYEYCIARVRLARIRGAFMEAAKAIAAKTGVPLNPLAAEIYQIESGRNGKQVKAHPHRAELHEAWREWRSLVAMLGLSPTDERNLLPGQGDLFDESDQYFE